MMKKIKRNFIVQIACALGLLACGIGAVKSLLDSFSSGFAVSPAQMTVSFLFAGGSIVICIILLFFGSSKKPETFGSAHFASSRALKDAGLVGERGLELGQSRNGTVTIPERLQFEHVLLVAPTGMGKSSGVIIPGLLQESGQRGLFVNDVKGELYSKCAGSLARYMPVLFFAPLRPAESINYNPLAHIGTMEDAEDFAISWVDNTGLSEEPYYNETAKLLITAVVLHLVHTEPGAPLSRLADVLSSTSVDQIRQLLTHSKSDLARDIGKAFINNVAQDPKLAGGILSGMATRFLFLKNPTIRALTSTHPDAARNINFSRLAGQPGALFLSVSPQDTRRLRPLIACLIMQLMSFLTRRRPGARPFVLYLDELANAGKIPHYEEHISLVRGQGLALIQAIQDFGQLRRVYGDNDAATILANSTTKVFYPGVGKEEADYASSMTGASTVQVDSTTRQGLLSSGSSTTSWAQRPLMTPDEVRRMHLGELLVISKNVAPVVVENTPYFNRPDLAELTLFPAPGTISQTTHPLPPQTMHP